MTRGPRQGRPCPWSPGEVQGRRKNSPHTPRKKIPRAPLGPGGDIELPSLITPGQKQLNKNQSIFDGSVVCACFCLFSTISVRFQYDLISRGAIKINQFQKSLGQLNRGQLNRSAPQVTWLCSGAPALRVPTSQRPSRPENPQPQTYTPHFARFRARISLDAT